MKTVSQFAMLFCAFCLLSGCAVGNRYSYDSGDMILPVSGSGELGLLIADLRPYVLSGDKDANFVGLQRGGFGNPFDVKTLSGKPLAGEMQLRLARGLNAHGFVVTTLQPSGTGDDAIDQAVLSQGKGRNLIIRMREWKSDALASFGLSYDLDLEVLNQAGDTLASNRIQGNKERLGGAGFESANSNSASRAFEEKIGELFDSPEIRAQLQTNQ